MNRVVLIGNLGKDTEVRFTQTGNAVCNFSIAISEKWRDQSGELKEKTEWVNIVVWGKRAEACGQYLAKGSKVAVEGKLQTRSVESNGFKKYVTEVVAERVEFLSTPRVADGGEHDGAAHFDPADYDPPS